MKRQPSEWEKKTANEATDKELISKIYKQLLQFNSRKINDPIKKMGQRSKQTFLQRRHTDGKQTHEKMLNITHYQRNANQNHNELPSHSTQDSCYQKVYKQSMLERVRRKGNPPTLLVRMQTSKATTENRVEIP